MNGETEMSDDKPTATAPAAPKLTSQPKGQTVKLTAAEWLAIHGPDPSLIYELRPRAWRPLLAYPDEKIAFNSPAGPVGSFLKAKLACDHCAATVQEIVSQDGAARCLGCGASVAPPTK